VIGPDQDILRASQNALASYFLFFSFFFVSSMECEFGRGKLQLVIGRMVTDATALSRPKTVALVQNRQMEIGHPRAFVKMTAGEARPASRCG